MTAHPIARALLFAIVCICCACSNDLTQLMVVLDTDLAVPDEVTTVHVQVTGPSGRTHEASAELGLERPVMLALVAPDGETVSGEVTVIAEARLGGEPVASRSITTSFVEGRVKAVPVCVARACTTSCPEQSLPGSALSDWSGDVASPCAPPVVPDPSASLGQVLVVRQIDGQGIFMNRAELRAGASLESLSDVFEDAFGEAQYPDDRDGALSPNGAWMVANMERGSCLGWGCVFLGPSDDPTAMRPMQVRFTSDTLLHASHPTVGDGGDLVIYESEPALDGHFMDLWATRLVDGEWSAPVPLTRDSTSPYNKLPRLSFDGAHVLFSCSFEIYGYDHICEVALDGSGFREILRPDQAPPGIVAERSTSLDGPRYEPDGGIVFGTTWTGYQLWRLRPGADEPERVLGPFDENVGQPCVLPSGHIVAVRGAFTTEPGPTIGVFEADGDLLFEIGTSYEPGQLTWLDDCGPSAGSAAP